jgi:rfaE bifunctional protein kinase chain/domain
MNKDKVLVVGDIMLDKYVIGEVSRISPEAPVPVVNVKETKYNLGGCGNVIKNLWNLDVDVTCLTAIGQDKEGRIIERFFENNFFHTIIDTTTVKERIIADDRQVQMLRIDRELKDPILSENLIRRIGNHTSKYDLIVVSDYGKGVVTVPLMDFLRSLNKPIIVDPVPCVDAFERYKNVYMITPNEKEFKLLLDYLYPFAPFAEIENILVTEGKKGMFLYNKGNTHKINANPVEVYNVTGAGDVVLAVMAKCFLLGIDVVTSTRIACRCAEYAVTKPGTSVISEEIFFHWVEVCQWVKWRK